MNDDKIKMMGEPPDYEETTEASDSASLPCYMDKKLVFKKKHIGIGPNGRYAFIYLGNVYLPKEVIGHDVKLSIKAELAI